ncbi:zinc finger protein 664-like isoform X2 [Ornithodoros turicata]|uniref:zinc finger protein 664-like isoform X2 n=1 Tax=Ornithodoros turicata TaxID=34597 RepID=UPI003138EB5A
MTANGLLHIKEGTRHTRVFESSHIKHSDSQLQEMQLSPEFSGHLVRVKSEPPDVACLPEEGQQTQQQHHDEPSPGGDADGVTAGTCRIKEEPQEDSSNKHPIIEVKTEPYNIAVLTEQDQMGHSRHSASEARASGGMPYIKGQAGSTCDQASSADTSTNAQFKINTTPAEQRFNSTALVTGEKPYKCNVCPAVFRHSTGLSRHKRTHTGEKYKCDACPAEFSLSGYLQRHKRTHTGEKPYKCNVCTAGFSRSEYLHYHMRTHTGEKPYKCDVCPAEFSRNGHLRDHRRAHTGEKPYKCDLCPAEFTRNNYLQHHKRTHTGEKPYKCDVCHAEFSRREYLREHMRTHTGEKPYKCDACPAEFSRNGNLQDHRRTHTGEKPYKCDVCLANFRQSGTLQYHKRTHTGEKTYKRDACLVEFRKSSGPEASQADTHS